MHTDSPLKLLVSFFAKEFASWLLGKNVVHAVPMNRELIRNPKHYALDTLLTIKIQQENSVEERLLH